MHCCLPWKSSLPEFKSQIIGVLGKGCMLKLVSNKANDPPVIIFEIQVYLDASKLTWSIWSEEAFMPERWLNLSTSSSSLTLVLPSFLSRNISLRINPTCRTPFFSHSIKQTINQSIIGKYTLGQGARCCSSCFLA